MKKLYSLIRACMTSDMKIFKIKTKKNSKSGMILPLIIAGYLMFMIWCYANSMFETLAPMHLQYVILSLFVFAISFMTIIEGIYKIGPLLFNCKDDQLLLSLPIERRTVLFVRILKFYIFELLYNSLFLLPVMVAYIRWNESLDWTYFLTSIIMLLLLPVIPIVISCVLGFITSSISSRFKYKNIAQIALSMVLIIGILFLSYNSEGALNYIAEHATSLHDAITRIYYPAGVYAKLIADFSYIDLLIFILVNVGLLTITIFVLGKVYFKINSRLKGVTANKKVKVGKLKYKSESVTMALVKKELNTFFSTPVFIINAGFALVLFVLMTIIATIKFESIMPILTSQEGLGLSNELVMSNKSILIFMLVSVAAYMTSISNSLISLEGKNINIVKSLPINTKTILMSKILSCLFITTPVILIGDIILFIKLKISIIEVLLLVILSILMPLVSHFIGLLTNLKYPKLDAENATEVVKQSTSSFVSVLLGMIILILVISIVTRLIGIVSSTIILLVAVTLHLIINLILYLRLITHGVKEFNALSI